MRHGYAPKPFGRNILQTLRVTLLEENDRGVHARFKAMVIRILSQRVWRGIRQSLATFNLAARVSLVGRGCCQPPPAQIRT